MEESLVKQFHEAKINGDEKLLNQLFLDKAPETLIKFCSGVDGSHIASLIRNQIWMSNATFFNDPLDCVMNFDFDKDISISAQDRRIDTFARENLNSAIIPKCRVDWDKRVAKLKKNFNSTYVSCFAEPDQITSLLMWAYYANGHRGYCIEYDISAIRKWGIDVFPVYYSDFYVTQQLFDCNRIDSPEMWKFLFDYVFTKSSEWKQEKEWRMFTFGEETKSGMLLPFAAPKNIYFGCKTSKEDILTMQTALKGISIGFYQMQVVEGQYKLETTKVEC